MNQELLKLLHTMVVYLKMDDVPFKPQAYEKAEEAITALNTSVEVIYKNGGLKALTSIPGVGFNIANHIEEFIKTKTFKAYQEYSAKYPIHINTLSAIQGVGPKTLKILYEKLKIINLRDLRTAALSGQIATIPGFGEKTQQNILDGIKFLERNQGYFLLGDALPMAESIKNDLNNLAHVENVIIAGSLRRKKEIVKDIDILVISDQPKMVTEFFVSMPSVERIYGRGETKSNVRLKNGIDVDLRIIHKQSLGAALSYFTGSKNHNIRLRQIAIDKGYKLNEYGLFKDDNMVAGLDETSIYNTLGLQYIEPELREDNGEIEAAQNNTLPKLIPYDNLIGDCQIQTNWSDGANSIEEMADAGQKAGLEYIVITDHTKSLGIAHGLDEARLLQQGVTIDKINKKLTASGKRFTVLKGSEVDILKDGSLDIDDSVLEKLDVVGASVHSGFKMSGEEMTKRIIKAMENPNVDILFHPTGRMLQRREPYDVDIDEIIEVAKRTGTILEIDAIYSRLDLKDEHIRRAVKSGVKFTIDSDAHSLKDLDKSFGVAQARRGWATKDDVINTRPLSLFLKSLKGRAREL